MADGLKPGKGKSPPRPKTPAPILVPSGRKHRGKGLSGWVQGRSAPPAPQETEAPEKPKPAPKRKGMIITPGSVQRATTQMLPGRLEPLDPSIVQQEIRFIRQPGEDQVVTLGWNLGEPPAHVTLNHRSVQPLHARMSYRDGSWWIENLADFDPVVLNQESLDTRKGPTLLKNGDRVRVGDILFRFIFP